MIVCPSFPKYTMMGGKCRLVYLDENGEKELVDSPVRAYGFLDASSALMLSGRLNFEEVDLRDVYVGKKVYYFDSENPVEIGKIGRELAEKGLKSFETDIPYVRRLLVDKELQLKYSGVVYVDVELDDSQGWRKKGEMQLLSYAYSFGDDVKYVYAGNETSKVSELFDEMVKRGVYVICGWNVAFDVEHLWALMAKDKQSRKYIKVLQHSEQIDLRSLYMFHKKGVGAYSLDNVARVEGLGGKEKHGKVSSLSRNELEEYNVRDVELLLKLNEKYSFVERLLRMSTEFSIPVSDIQAGETVVWDYLILRRLRELGYVAPRKQYRKQANSYEGALILEPEPGLKEKVAVFDFVSLYPSIILRDKLDVFNFSGEVVPYFMAEFMKRKTLAEESGDMLGREVWKIMMNSCYGMFGYVGSRYYDERKAAHVTREGRKALSELVKFLQDMNVKVYFGDTDSVFIDATVVGNLKALENLINRRFYPLQVKLDKVFERVLFFGREGKGIKKRYAGITVDGKLVERGVETRRGDWCSFTKMVVKDVLMLVLSGVPRQVIEDKLDSYRRSLYSGKVSEVDLMMVKHLREDLTQYKVKPAWVKLWEEKVRKGEIPETSREISYWFGQDGELVTDPSKIVYRVYWEKQVMPPVKRVLDSLVTIQFLTEVRE